MSQQTPSDSNPPVFRRLYRQLRALDRQTQFLMDLAVLVAAFTLAYLLRYDFQVPESAIGNYLRLLPVVIILQVAVTYLCGIYTFIWRFVGLAEVRTFAIAAVIAPLPLFAMRFGLPDVAHAWRPPISIILIDNLLAFGGMLLLRVVRRSLYEHSTARAQARGRAPGERVLVLGAGHTGVAIVREIKTRGDTGLEAVGILDDDASKIGSVISGVRVLGPLSQLAQEVRATNADQVICAIAQLPAAELRQIVSICDALPVALRIVPPLAQILDGSVSISRLRAVEIEDLLGREPVQLDSEGLQRFLSGRRVLITGAGGSIGAEIARQVLSFQPRSLVLVERAEFPLFELLRELEALPGEDARGVVHPIIADAGHEERMRSVFSTHRPEVVIHAAAHKHVGLMEHNACEAVHNNVGVTEVVSRLAGEFEVGTFVFVSTDKAVRPTSVMGATKRVAERIVSARDREYSTRYVSVRFGNVLGSTGSVIPIFRDQIAQGGPVTVTHPEMVRYFMTIPEASQLVLQAGSFGRGGEILLLDMGEPVPIIRLAEDMIRLSGLTPYEDVSIVFSGARPGEKLVEELSLESTDLSRTQHPKIFVTGHGDDPDRVSEGMQELLGLADLGLESDVRQCLRKLVPEAQLSLDRPSRGRAAESGRKLTERARRPAPRSDAP